MSGILSYLRVPALAVSGFATLASGALYWKQNELIYPRYLPQGARTEEGFLRPSYWGIDDYEECKLITPDGETLVCYLIRPTNKLTARKVTVLMFHGNAGNIGHRVPIAKVILENTNCNIFMLEYRGYGLSTGEPEETGFVTDAQTALEYLRQHNDTKGNDIIVYGQSIGGAVATQLVAKNLEAEDIKGLILENTFTSLRKLIPSVLPAAKYIAGLCHQKWATDEFLPKITNVPILFLSGLKDEIIPAAHMKELRSICKAKDMTWKEFPNGTHNETVAEPGYFFAIIDFIKEKGRSAFE